MGKKDLPVFNELSLEQLEALLDKARGWLYDPEQKAYTEAVWNTGGYNYIMVGKEFVRKKTSRNDPDNKDDWLGASPGQAGFQNLSEIHELIKIKQTGENIQCDYYIG